MMKIFHFYFSILGWTSVYTNTDRMGWFVCGLLFFFFTFFYFYIFFHVYITSAFQNSTQGMSAKELQSSAVQAQGHTEPDVTSRTHAMSGFNGVSRRSMESGF